VYIFIRLTLLLWPFQVAIFEVYGDYGEYISTTKGDLLDDVEGSCLYECRMDFKKPQSEILLKVSFKYIIHLIFS